MRKFLLGMPGRLLYFRRPARPNMGQMQQFLAWQDSQEFVYKARTRDTKIFSDQWAIRRYSFELRPLEGMLLEFGVYKGATVNFFSDILLRQKDRRTVYGFDSFSGFSEEWCGIQHRYSKGHFRLSELPRVNANVRLVEGFIEDTLPKFVEGMSDDVAFLHIDTDTYSPAKTVLGCLKTRFRSGTIVLFDQLAGYPNWRFHEYAALSEELDDKSYEFIGFATKSDSADLIKAAIRIL